MSGFVHVDEANFDALVLQSAAPVLLEFGAAWCRPCKQLEPVLLALAQEWNGRALLAKVDVDQSADLAVRFQVMGVPTVILFKGGQPAARFTGYLPREKVIDKIAPFL